MCYKINLKNWDKKSPNPLQTDNSTACGFVNGTIKQKYTKAIDMRFYWLRDQTNQKQFLIYWAPGLQNRANYFTKQSQLFYKTSRS